MTNTGGPVQCCVATLCINGSTQGRMEIIYFVTNQLLAHLVLVVDIGPSQQQSFNYMHMSIQSSYSQRNRTGRNLVYKTEKMRGNYSMCFTGYSSCCNSLSKAEVSTSTVCTLQLSHENLHITVNTIL